MLGLVGERCGVAVQARVCLDGKPPVAAAVPVEDRLEDRCCVDRKLLYYTPANFGLAGGRSFFGELGNPGRPPG